MKKNKYRKNKVFHLILLVLLLVLSVGYALIATELRINGTLSINKTSWDIHFENLIVNTNSVSDATAPECDNETTTELEYVAHFTKPGDFYEFTVDIVNNGTIDAMIENVSNLTYEANGTDTIDLPDYLESTITYSDGTPIKNKQLLTKRVDENTPTREKIKVRVAFRTDINPNQLPKDSNETTKFKLVVNYKQADNTAQPIRIDFQEASWDEIISAYQEGNTKQLMDAMEAGTTREVKLDLDHDGTSETTKHVRIANLSKCENGETSKTACGLVFEFTDMIAVHRMNIYDSSKTTVNGYNNKGGWEYSDMRAYLNGLRYLEESDSNSVDYTESGVIDAMPTTLKSKIIRTTVISGYGSRDSNNGNFETNDLLYLLSPHEIWEDDDGNTNSGINVADSSYGTTKQLDYYRIKETTVTKYSSAVKTGGQWWLRSAYSGSDLSFFNVWNSGGYTDYRPHNQYGVSPAFRLSE